MATTVTEFPTGSLKAVVWDWTADISGNVTQESDSEFGGIIVCAEQVPSSGGSQPTDQYDVTIEDADGADVLGGTGANISNTGTTCVQAGLGVVYRSALTLKVANAGGLAEGQTIVFIR